MEIINNPEVIRLIEDLAINYEKDRIKREISKAIKNAKIAMMPDGDCDSLADVIFSEIQKRSNNPPNTADKSAEITKEKPKEEPKTEEPKEEPKKEEPKARKGDIPKKAISAVIAQYNLIKTTEEINATLERTGNTNMVHDVGELWKEMEDIMYENSLSEKQVKNIIASYEKRLKSRRTVSESLEVKMSDSELSDVISSAVKIAMERGWISDFMRLSDNEINRITTSVNNALNKISGNVSKSDNSDRKQNDAERENRRKKSFDYADETINAINKARNARTANESLTEAAGLSRINDYLNKYDCACISAQKYLPSRQEFKSQKEYEDEFKSRLGKQKKLDSKALQVELRSKFGGVINIQGFYKYGTSEKADKEKSYLVVNRSMSESEFKSTMLELACDAKQNSYFFSPKGSRSGYWIYTGIDLSEPDEVDKYHSKGDEEYVGVIYLGRIKQDKESTSYSLVNDRPFVAMKKENAVVIDESVEQEPYGNVIYRNEGEYANKVKRVVEEEKKKKKEACCSVSDDVGDLEHSISVFNSSFANSGTVSEELSSMEAVFKLNRIDNKPNK